MPSVRLNEGHRSYLRRLARESVKCPAEAKAEQAAYKAAAPKVLALVVERFPPKDMKVLARYKVASLDGCIRLNLTAGGVDEFRLGKGDSPFVPNVYCGNRIFQADRATTEAFHVWVTAKAAHDEAVKRKLGDYDALITHAKTLEEVEAVWPAATALRPTLDRNLPMVLSSEVIARIQADVLAASHRRAEPRPIEHAA